jgi:tetratricopeptide (TPR) repeat protein
MWRESGDYNMAAHYYRAMMDVRERIDGQMYADLLPDVNTLGNLYYQAGTLTTVQRNPQLIAALMADDVRIRELAASDPGLSPDSLRNATGYFTAAFQKHNLLKADSVFNKLVELAPESYTGYYYLARTGNALYPGQAGIDNGIPKEMYSKTVSIIDGRGDGQEPSPMMMRALREALGYMAYYYYLTGDTANAMLYSGRLLEIDPQNANANAIRSDILANGQQNVQH